MTGKRKDRHSRIKILIADDHPIVRQGLKHILAEESDMAIEGEAYNSQGVLELIRKEKGDILILDITLPGRGGLEVLREIKRGTPKLPVLILSMHPEEQYGVRALKAGAAGYLSKESVPEKLVEAVRTILSGRKYISPVLAEKLAWEFERDSSSPLHEGLSDREYQILCLIASGRTLTEIARELCLSVKTISTYRARILNKMKMKNNAELTHYAIRNRLID
ncbi:MAG: response regulator transcription factor [Deltaproteobacteria bacterium]|nr:response regulator transcription factor [Deltaproteobacteria bacterium]